jgi:hypothetical protein
MIISVVPNPNILFFIPLETGCDPGWIIIYSYQKFSSHHLSYILVRDVSNGIYYLIISSLHIIAQAAMSLQLMICHQSVEVGRSKKALENKQLAFCF